MKKVFCVILLIFGACVCQAHLSNDVRVIRSYPINGASNIHPLTKIGITFSDPIEKNSLYTDSITVFGNSGKKYFGLLKLSFNAKTLIFSPSEPFLLGDVINVRVGNFQTTNVEMTPTFLLTFSVRKSYAFSDPNFHSDDPIFERQLHGNENQVLKTLSSSRTLSDPNDTLPELFIRKDDNPSEGNLYIANYTWLSIQPNTYGLQLDKDGNVKKIMGDGADYYNDFKPNPNGTYSFFDAVKNLFFLSDTNFQIIDTIKAPFNYTTDGHELRITADGNYFFLGVDYVVTDMTTLVSNGQKVAVIVAPVVLEFDRDKNLIFEWRSYDHFKVTDATYEDLTSTQIDFCHINAIEFDTDSNLLVSCRHMDEITKINTETGDIIWRWGGKNNEFTLEGDSMYFSHQHALRRTDGGTYTMFDNGNFHINLLHPFSRAVEYQLDQTNKIAAKIWEFQHQPEVFGAAMGYVQRLPNNGTLIGWGECDTVAVTELDSHDNTIFEMGMTKGNYSYRAYKYDSNYIHGGLQRSSASLLDNSLIQIAVMPNPVTDAAKIECTIPTGGYVDISLYDALGRELSKIYSGYLSQGRHEYIVDAKNLAVGAYHIHGNISGSSIDEQIIVLK